MAAPVTAPDEIVELHNALNHTPLDDVETLRRMAFRARALAAKRPRDFLVVLTAAQALAKSGQREEAVAFARRAFDLRFGAPFGREEITWACFLLGLSEQAAVAARESCDLPALAGDKVAIGNASKAALLVGDVALLCQIRSFASESLRHIPARYLHIVERESMERHLRGHMEIVSRYVKDVCCYVEIEVNNGSDDGCEQSVHIEYRLDLPFRACLKRFDETGEELRAYYIAAGRDDLPYLNAVVHGFSPMPAHWEAAA